MFFTYILFNSIVNKYYIGSTSDIEKRLKEHNKPTHKTKFTRKQPGKWALVYTETFATRPEARKREKQIKRWKSKKRISQLTEQSRL